MLRILKNWWFQILTIITIIADQGFEFIEPLLVDLGVSAKVVTYVKVALIIAALVKAKTEAPSQNPEKLKKLANRKAAKAAKSDDGDPTPGKGW